MRSPLEMGLIDKQDNKRSKWPQIPSFRSAFRMSLHVMEFTVIAHSEEPLLDQIIIVET